MKKTVLIALLLLLGIALAFPQPGYSWGPWWYGPGAVVGAGAALLGAAIGGPGYYGPPAAYGYPPPAYGYPARAYGYPYYGPRYYSGYGYHGYYGPRYYSGYGYHGYYGGRGYGYRGYYAGGGHYGHRR
jgi:hypothetical protein